MNTGRTVARAVALAALAWSGSACRGAPVDRAPSPKSTPVASAVTPTVPVALKTPAVALKTTTRSVAAGEDVAIPPRDARHEPCGSFSRLLAAGSSEQRPNDDDRVLLEYATFARAGQRLDDSTAHDEPLAESVRNLPPGVACVVKRMRVGESRRVWLSGTLQQPDAHGARAKPGVDRTIDITLRKLTRAPERPLDYASPPRAAQRTQTGLQFELLHRGSEQRRPVANSRVSIYHSGWTNRGVLFESSALAGQPASYLVYELPTGLAEGVQLMHIGDKMRFWLPERLAYGSSNRNAPKGPVVFDVELLAID
jgi:FKBP-type peptidyl-prolyl cis-trans isomerase